MASVDFRYARALALVVSDQKMDIVATQGQLSQFTDILDESADLCEVLDNPSIPEPQKMSVLNALGDRLGISPTIRNFIAVVARHGRIHQMRELVASYASISDEETHVSEVEIASAHPLDEGNRRLLEEHAVRLSGGNQIKTTYREDPSLLGGAVIRIGSTVYDGSIRSQLRELQRRMATAGL